MPKHYKCQFQIFDTEKKRFRYCKNNKCILDFCKIHYKFVLEESVVIVQTFYRGYRIRKKLNNIYYNLPRDLQRKIIWHMNEDIYIRNYNSSIFKLIKFRYDTFYDNIYYTRILMNTGQYRDVIMLIMNNDSIIGINFLIELFSLLHLSVKYYSIIDINKLNKIHLYFIKKFSNALSRYLPYNNKNYILINNYNRLF